MNFVKKKLHKKNYDQKELGNKCDDHYFIFKHDNLK